MAMFMIGFSELYFEQAKPSGVYCDSIEAAKGGNNNAFNVRQEANFITINPDGTVTTNPLFTDLTETYLGNLNEQGLDEIIKHPNRQLRVIEEVKRTRSCVDCDHYESCAGGASHAPIMDTLGGCAGLLQFRDAMVESYV